MFTGLTIENFKCFGERTEIPLAPITLIYGPNSSGKSTILQMLYLLKQSMPRTEIGGIQTLVLGGPRSIVDFGGYHGLIHDHDTSLPLRIAFRWHVDAPEMITAEEGGHIPPNRNLQCEFEYKYDPSLRAPLLVKAVFDLNERGTLEASVFPTSFSKYKLVTTTQDHATNFRYAKENRVRILAGIHCAIDATTLDKLDPRGTRYGKQRDWCDDPVFMAARKEQEARYEEAIDLLSHDFTFEEYCAHPWSKDVCGTGSFCGYLPDPSGARLEPRFADYSTMQSVSREGLPEQEDYWAPVGPSSLTIEQFFADRPPPDKAANELIEACRRTLARAIGEVLPVAPVRDRANAMPFQLSWNDDLGFSGAGMISEMVLANQDSPTVDQWYTRQLHGPRNPRAYAAHILTTVNEWLNKLSGYVCDLKEASPDLPEQYLLRLVDKRRSAPISVTVDSTGFGLSQLLPLVTRSILSRFGCITIEQPEIHLHPRLQAELADLFLFSAQSCHNQFIIETHSEHLLLRVQRLMRRGALKPDQVRVLYVSRHEDGSNVQELRLNEKGQFLDPWPDGFFPERAEEVFGE